MGAFAYSEPCSSRAPHTRSTLIPVRMSSYMSSVAVASSAQAKDEEHEAGPGTLQFIPAGKKHWLRNVDSFEPVELIGGYTGVGSLDEAGYEFIAHLTS